MASVINTNTLSMVTQQNLNQSQNALNTSMERLSSGLRINSAKDDAAGQAIANRMDAQITGLSQAQRNANDGISLAQTTEGALNQVNDNLLRVRELTVQAQNGTNSAEDLSSIQDEITQRMAEIDRISDQTNFNGTNVLDGSKSEVVIQVGADDNQSISINLKNMDIESLGLSDFSVSEGIDVDDIASTASTKARVGDDVALSSTGFTKPSGGDGTFGDFKVDDSGQYYVEYAGDSTPANNGTYNVTIDDDGTATLGTINASPGDNLESVEEVKKNVTLSGDDATNTFAYTGSDEDAPEYVIKDDSGDTTVYYSAGISDTGEVTRGEELHAGGPTPDPLKTIDAALSMVDDMRSDLGAVQNRFDSAITNLATTETNLASAQSRIQDADYAEEVSSMTTAQILQQAGTSMLTQANQVPQNVLSLLG
ncbi:FliC/FljB family flagellin [Cobetia amphilecti]|uniref:FliC/FljB family flagellin n=1 Tax=Cobetia amphilecti TaxID=1055104 RepID=UPI0029430EB7|nr:FliC/FljB family flagellin [Cobetia amphilecti]WOI24614.1 FliC/FljB family flagellin [Cobetia amphilecti]